MRTRKFAALTAAAAIAAGLLTVLSPGAAQASTCCFRYKNGNGKYLGASNGLAVVNSTGVAWTDVSDGTYLTIWDQSSNRNLGLSGNATSSGTRAALVVGSSSNTQDWKPVFVNDTQFELKNRATNLTMCLGISGGSSGTNVAIFACDGATNQLWTR